MIRRFRVLLLCGYELRIITVEEIEQQLFAVGYVKAVIQHLSENAIFVFVFCYVVQNH